MPYPQVGPCKVPFAIFLILCNSFIRSVTKNTKEARQILITRLDNLYNKELSVENQLKVMVEGRSVKQDQKRRKLQEMKDRWRVDNEKGVEE